MGLDAWNQLDVDLKWGDSETSNPSHTKQLEFIGRLLVNFKQNHTIGPPTAEILWSVRDALADIPFEQESNLLLDSSAIRCYRVRIATPSTQVLYEASLNGRFTIGYGKVVVAGSRLRMK